MTHYLYIPFTRKQFPLEQQEAVNAWIAHEKEKKKDVIVCYKGEKLPPFPPSATVGVWLHGKPGPMPAHSLQICSQVARSFASTSGHLQVTHKDKTVMVPQIADDMIEDGLLNHFNANPKNSLRIKLFFFDVGRPHAEVLANAFLKALKYKDGKPRMESKQGNIRVDFYPGHLSELKKKKGEIGPAHKFVRPTPSQEEIRAHTVRRSLFNEEAAAPQLTIAQMNQVIQNYNDYKSARLHGLSGLLGLNGFFSSDASQKAINELSNNQLSDAERFNYATQFLKRYPATQLAKCLRFEVTASQSNNNQLYSAPQISAV